METRCRQHRESTPAMVSDRPLRSDDAHDAYLPICSTISLSLDLYLSLFLSCRSESPIWAFSDWTPARYRYGRRCLRHYCRYLLDFSANCLRKLIPSASSPSPPDVESETVGRLSAILRSGGVNDFCFKRVAPDYYDWPLESRRDVLGASSVDHLCKSIVLVKLADPDVVSNPSEYQKLAQSMSELDEVVSVFQRFKDCEKQLLESKVLAKEAGDDEDMAEMIGSEISSLSKEIEELEKQLKEIEEMMKIWLTSKTLSKIQ